MVTMTLSIKAYRKLKVAQDRQHFQGKWYPRIVLYAGAPYVVSDNEPDGRYRLTSARPEDWACGLRRERKPLSI